MNREFVKLKVVKGGWGEFINFVYLKFVCFRFLGGSGSCSFYCWSLIELSFENGEK